MHYLQATRHKVILLSAVGLFLFLAVVFTFAYKNARFGNQNLPHVVYRLLEQKSAEVYYRLRFASLAGFAGAGAAWGVTRPLDYEARSAVGIPVLVYHGLSDSKSDKAVSKAEIASQLFALKRAGWQTITLRQFEDFMRGAITLPERSFLLTFDDGAKDSYYPVDPLLKALPMNAVSFILPAHSLSSGSSYYLSMGEITAMLQSGRWEIGSHGQNSHVLLPVGEGGGAEGAALANRLWLTSADRIETEAEYELRVRGDLLASKNNLERAFSIPIRDFAFPFGEFGQMSDVQPAATKDVARLAEGIYAVSFHQARRGEGFSYNYPADNAAPMILARRIEPVPGTSADSLVERFEYGLPKGLPFSDDFSTERGWFSVWGDFDFSPGSIALRASLQETGNAVVLDGSGGWRDYKVAALMRSPGGSGAYLWMRFRDNDNHAGCNFGDGFLHAEETKGGVTRVAKGVRGSDVEIPAEPFYMEAEVSGRTLTCRIRGIASVTYEFLDPALAGGGIGFKTWEPQPERAELIVEHVSVEGIE